MDVRKADSRWLAGIYRRQNAVLVEGQGAVCRDEDGKTYIDFGAGIGVNSLGYCDEEWVAAVCEQAGKLQHTSNLYYTEPAVRLAEKLTQATGYEKSLFCNSGAEANECAIKIARKYSCDKYGLESGRNRILCLNNSFHGRTVTTLSATGQAVFHNFFFPFTEGFDFVESGDIAGVKEILSKGKTCAVLMEFIQGEGGVNPLPSEFVQELDALCREKDILLMADEVQTGIGRTGRLLAGENYSVRPNITTLAKGLGGGLPIGAVLMDKATADVLGPGDHGTTYGGNPVACAGALVAVRRICEKTFLSEVRRKGMVLRERISGFRHVLGVDGMGMMLGVRMQGKTAAEVSAECLEQGLLVLTAKEKLRLLPPLTIADSELEKGLSILESILN